MALLVSGCAAPAAKQWYQACLDAGQPEPQCRMGAIEVNQRAWAGFQAGMQSAAPARERRPIIPDQVLCTSTTADVLTTTHCQSR